MSAVIYHTSKTSFQKTSIKATSLKQAIDDEVTSKTTKTTKKTKTIKTTHKHLRRMFLKLVRNVIRRTSVAMNMAFHCKAEFA